MKKPGSLQQLLSILDQAYDHRSSNWFRRPQDASERAWRADVALLDRMHRLLREAAANLPVRQLSRTPKGSTVSTSALLSGVAAHDLYHAGQIQLLKKLSPGP